MTSAENVALLRSRWVWEPSGDDLSVFLDDGKKFERFERASIPLNFAQKYYFPYRDVQYIFTNISVFRVQYLTFVINIA